ncbi:MAG TPA: hypothetical protein VE890_00835, partial [Thermoguttaceae bacterium]|nr:hypothetical protein [Thermoguttaceae bacterium]
MLHADKTPDDSKDRSYLWKRLLALGFVLVAVVWGSLQFGDSLTLGSLAGRESQLRQFQVVHP